MIYNSFNIKNPKCFFSSTTNSVYQQVTMLRHERTGKGEMTTGFGDLTISKAVNVKCRLQTG